jgi:hypothetical protein
MFTKAQRDCNRRSAISQPMKESIDYLRLRQRQGLADHHAARIFGARPSAYR